jgi:hypothetical protein
MRWLVVVVIAGCHHPTQQPPAPSKSTLVFEEAGDSRFVARGCDFTAYFGDAGAVLASRDAPPLRLIAGEPRGIAGVDPQRARVNYLVGRDPAGWHSEATYGAVKYEQVYDGIDLIFHGRDRQLEYDFTIAPGADPDRIALAIEGADRIALDGGDAVIGELREHRPFAYQDRAGERVAIDVEYQLRDEALGFAVGAYDRSRELVIDPVLTYSTFLGGNQADSGGGVAVDPSGNIYLSGTTQGNAFPTKSPLQPTDHSVTNNAFIAKLDASGALVYSTYLGGSGGDVGNAIAVDNAGNAYVAGNTGSTDFPTKNPAQSTFGGMTDGFIAVLAPDGQSLVYSTYLGGATSDALLAIAIDGSGNAYGCGVTDGNFPVTNGVVQKTFGGSQDAFAVKLTSAGAISYATYVGGSGYDSAWGIAVDGGGNAYITGQTDSLNFPTHLAVQGTKGGGVDAFVSAIGPTGAAFVYSTYLGGAGDETGQAIAVDSASRAYVAGDTTGSFPVSSAAYQRTYGGGPFDMFVARLANGGATIDWASYLGGAGNDQVKGIGVGGGYVWVAGGTTDGTFPTAAPIQSYAGSYDAVVAELDDTGANLVFSTYLGGAGSDGATGIAVTSAGAFYVTGNTSSTAFPVVGALQPTYGGGVSDVFVATNAGNSNALDHPPGGDDPAGGGGRPGGCCDTGGGSNAPIALIVAILLGIPRRRRAL